MQSYKNLKVMVALTFLIGSLSLLSGCGGGGSGVATPAGNGGATGTNGMISGTAVKGPISGGTVTAYAISNGTMGAELANGTTDGRGNFTMSIGSYTGPVMLQIGGGTFVDEATGATTAMLSGDVMTAVMASLSTGATVTGVQITPLTSMAQAMAYNMTDGMTNANIAAANTAVGTYFMVSDILHTQPMNPLVAGSGNGATQDMKNYGMAIAAMTQYAKNIGMTSPSAIVTAMVNDASDGVMNGLMDSSPITMGGGMMAGTMMQSTAGTTGLANAMTQFMESTQNKSGLTTTAEQTLINQLDSSSGQLLGTGGIVASGMISGTSGYGPVKSGTVMAFAVNNGLIGAQLASGTTDTQGNFTMSIGSYSGPVMLQTSNGAYTDLATGTTMTMASGDVMTAVIPTVSSGATVTGIQMTPLTSMAQTWAQNLAGGMTDANITSANTAVGNYFMVSDILHTQPMNPLLAGSGTGATQDMKNYGASIAAMSQYAKNIGMTDSSGIITAMTKDASDGVMNGYMDGTQITMGGMGGGMMGSGTMMQSTAGTSGLATAMTQFMGSTLNESGVTTTDVQTLIDQLGKSNGTL